MRIVAGVDFEFYPNSMSLLRELRFAEAEVNLIHVVESVFPDKSFPELKSDHPLSQMIADKEREGISELGMAAELLGTDYDVRKSVVRGDPAQVLVQQAGALGADLIAVGSGRKSRWGSMFFGSITKALTSASDRSFLVCKSKPRGSDMVAILATDHSDYANRCIDRFLEFGIRGIKKIRVLSSSEIDKKILSSVVKDMPNATGGAEEAIIADFRQRNQAICEKLVRAGYESDEIFLENHANEAISMQVEELKADLVIMGARGHGFWDRLRLGSITSFQVVNTPHNILAIRI